MVFLQFPSKLTDEEIMLQAKYAKLRKKKKQLAEAKNNANKLGTGASGPLSEGGSEKPLDRVGKRERNSSTGHSAPLTPSATGNAKDAKEAAKKLIRSGSIAAIQKSAERVRTEQSAGFKRSQGLERKLTTVGGSVGSMIGSSASGPDNAKAGYQPFSATHGPGGGFDTGGEDMNPEPPPEAPPAKKTKNLYESFVHARDREERGLAPKGEKPGSSGLLGNTMKKGDDQLKGSLKDGPGHRQGNTIYVHGYNITEDLLKATFGSCGKIVNISMEVEKNCGFVTFDKAGATEKAIAEYNGNVVEDIQLKVSLARRQPVIAPINDASSSATWSTIAASHSQKGSHKDKRDLVAYDEELF